MALIDSGSNPDFKTKIPSLSDDADIQTALKAVLYGTDYPANSSAGTGVLVATDGSEGLVGQLNAMQTSLTNASVLKSVYTAKGVLLSATGASTPSALTVGTNGYLLKANSSTSTGLEWFDGTGTFLPRVAGSSYPLSGDLYVSADVYITGVLKDTVTANSQADSYTLVLADRGKMIECTKGTANNVTVPLNSSVAYPTGTRIDVLQVGAGQVTIVATGGVTINGTPGLKLRAQWSACSLIKRATDTWVVVGDLSA